MAKAIAENRILLVYDLDFSRLVALSGASRPSVITFRLSDMRPHSIISHLMPLLQGHSADLARGTMVTITDWNDRIRLLPIGVPSTDPT